MYVPPKYEIIPDILGVIASASVGSSARASRALDSDKAVRLRRWLRFKHKTRRSKGDSYGAETSVLNWRDRLVCSRCGGHEIDMVVTGTRRPAEP
jgi:hypothetical protein